LPLMAKPSLTDDRAKDARCPLAERLVRLDLALVSERRRPSDSVRDGEGARDDGFPRR
jgi:hypothetical protein